MSWQCSQALVAVFSAGNCLDGEQCAQLKSIRIAERSCFDGKKKGTYRRSLSGMTYAPSTASRGVISWMSSLRASLVNRSASPANEKEKPTSGICGPTLSEYFAKYDPNSRCWKTSQACLLTNTCEQFSETWPKAGLIVAGDAFRRKTWELRTSGIGGGYWRTPTAQEAGAKLETLSTKDGQPAKVGQRAYRTQPNGKVVLQSVTLGQQVRMLPTPLSRDARTFKGANRAPNAKGSEPLIVQVGGTLNPPWVEWLMGWPIGWTDLQPLETGKFRQWCERHGRC